ncbi:hypothetical protein Tsubulata_051540 [Turnera subulata]|uniref:non-specific serine/threonine protein kinase n=1 Tax=Turnera subulata TaxID=218843 RepID=A0A9Q0JRK1_9ROSI|nr:hypothetical protein Tsubulata_051540 [Turnera subulata]
MNPSFLLVGEKCPTSEREEVKIGSFVFMGSCWGSCFSSSIKDGFDPKHSGIGGNSGSGSKVSSATVPSTPRTEGEILQSSNLKSFPFTELKAATRNFRPDSVLGEGGFGCVFKGWIDEHTLTAARPGTGMVIAVKRLNQESFQGHQEWLAEINYLGQLYHPNLVKLIGYCLEDDHRLLVYEFMPKGSLENHLFRRASYFQPLSWNLRVKVALGAAKGLAFLHSEKAKVLDARIEGQYSMSSVLKVATLAVQCLSTEPKFRPNAEALVKALEQLNDSSGNEGSGRSHAEMASKVHHSSSNSPKARRKSRNEVGNGKAASYERPSASPLRT